jgi:hypothetical protein
MKIGFSFSRCILSVLNKEVNEDDILLIVARTNIQEEHRITQVIFDYHSNGAFRHHPRQDCLDVALRLWKSGKIIEPRANGVYAGQVPSDYIWMDLFPTKVGTQSNAVTEAWNSYRMLISLTEQLPVVLSELDPDVGVTHGQRKYAD